MTRLIVGFSAEVVLDDDAIAAGLDWKREAARTGLRYLIETLLREHDVRVAEVKWWEPAP